LFQDAGSGSAIVKNWIRIRIKVKTQKLYRLTMEPLMAMNAHNRGMEAQKWSPGGRSVVAEDSHYFNEDQDLDPHLNDAEDKCVPTVYDILNPFSNLTLYRYFSSEYSRQYSKKANKK
jgi:hypothetical protein